MMVLMINDDDDGDDDDDDDNGDGDAGGCGGEPTRISLPSHWAIIARERHRRLNREWDTCQVLESCPKQCLLAHSLSSKDLHSQ